MKNRLLLILSLIIACLMTACDDNDKQEISPLHVLRSSIDFTAVGGVFDIEVEATGELTASSGAEWCRVIEITPEKVTIMARTNTEYAGRATRLTISDGVHTEIVSVTQQGDIFAPQTDNQVMRLNNKATTIPIKINSSFNYTVALSTGTDWIKVKEVDNGFTVSLDENTTGTPRAGIVRVKTDQGRYFDYTIYQYDVEQLIGEWRKGVLYTFWNDHIISDGIGLSSSPVTISSTEEDPGYTLAFPLTNTLIGDAMQDPSKATLHLHASYENGVFVVNSMQEQEGFTMDIEETDPDNEGEVTTKTVYGNVVLVSDNSFISTGAIGIAPVLYDGQLILTYVDVPTTPSRNNAFLSLCFFSESDSPALEDYILFAGLEIYR